MRARAWTFSVLAFGGALGGCSAILGLETDRHVAAGEATDAGPLYDVALPTHFECIDQPAPPAATGDVQLKLFIGDVTSASSSSSFVGSPVVGASLRACGRLDFECATPLSEHVTDDGGTVLFTVPSAFDGYYEGWLDGGPYAPAIYKRTPQIASEAASEAMTKQSLLAVGGALAGVRVDTTLGIAILIAQNCNSDPAEGIVFEVEGQAETESLVYLANSLPSSSQTLTDAASGSAVLFNVPPGSFTVSASFAADHRLVRKVTTIARGGWITFVQLRLDQSVRAPI